MRLEKKKGLSGIKLHHNKRLFWLIVFLVAVLISMMVYVRVAEHKNGLQVNNPIECSMDEDCIKQKLGCCPCSMGGEEICMSTKNSSLINEKLSKECGAKTTCMALYACKETSCGCMNGKCVENDK
jgi:hypothetical protein